MDIFLSSLKLTIGIGLIQLFVIFFPYFFLRKKKMIIIKKLTFLSVSDILLSWGYLFFFNLILKLIGVFDNEQEKLSIDYIVFSILASFTYIAYFFIIFPYILKSNEKRLVFLPEYSSMVSKELGTKINVYKTQKDCINAFATGFFPNNKIIVLGNKLLDNLTVNEKKAILYHELGHHKNNDLFRFYFFSGFSIVVFILFKLISFEYITHAFPTFNQGYLIAIYGCFYGLVNVVVFSKISHRAEYRADKFGADNTSKNDMKESLDKLSVLSEHITDEGSMTHPSLDKRKKSIDEN